MAKYLVTGGCGFIGSNLVDELIKNQHRVTVLDNLSNSSREHLNAQAELIVGDVSDQALVQKLMQDSEGCFHLAAMSSVAACQENWLQAHHSNLLGTLVVFDAAKSLQKSGISCPVVYASSAAVYGDNTHLPLLESAPSHPLSTYAVDKMSAECYARVGGLSHQLSTMGLRFFNVYGERQNPNSPYSGVISKFINQFIQRAPITIYGDGMQTRDFIYVQDVVASLILAMQHTSVKAPVVNICSGKQISLKELFDTLCRLSHYTPELKFAPARVGDIYHSCGDPHLAEKLLGFKAKVSLEEGLARLL